MLRILNAVRSPDIGIPITYAQYCHTGLRVLVERLINTHHHALAAKITMMVRIFRFRRNRTVTSMTLL